MTLSLLKYTQNLWNPSLKGIAIIGAQHLMESSLEMFRVFVNLGLDPLNTYLMGKCYSTDESVVKDFRDERFNIYEGSFYFDSHEKYDETYQREMKVFATTAFLKLQKGSISKLIVIDDGGYLIDIIHKLNINNIPIVCIEQTSSGFNYLMETTLSYPIINVARCKAKLDLETPFIFSSFFERLCFNLDKDLFHRDKFLILGNGTIGKFFKKKLEEYNYDANIFDAKFDQEDRLISLLNGSNIIIGASGYTSLRYEFYKHLKSNTTLASISSSDREFDACKFRRLFSKTNKSHKNFIKDGINLLQSGCPINFWKTRNNIDLEYIQITLAMLMGAVFQAVDIDSKEAGFISVHEQREQLIYKEFQQTILEQQLMVCTGKINKRER